MFGPITSLLTVGFLLLVSFYYSTLQPMLIQPINQSDFYYRGPLGAIYYDSISGCFDVCFSKSFSRLPEADKDSFQILEIPSPFPFWGKFINSMYAKDADTVFFQNHIIPEADARSFTAIDFSLSKDAWQYYFNGKKLSTYIKDNIDSSYVFNPTTLEVISYKEGSYIIVKNKSEYYYTKLNPQPMTIKSISSEEARRYDPLN